MAMTSPSSDKPRQIEETAARPMPVVSGRPDAEDDEEEDEELGLSQLQSFANRVQYSTNDANGAGPSSSRPKIVIPKRGEKDFEPLQETANLQDMMLQRSREALFSALLGVRGGNIQSITQAVLLPSSPYPRIHVVRGHLMDSIGISVSESSRGAGKRRQTYTELLPEEALYLLERGSLQIWIPAGSSVGDDPVWDEKEYSFKGSAEMSVMEGFSTFLGQDGLTWERYQAYAYLKRLGYTVHRTRRFLPGYFLGQDCAEAQHTAQPTVLPPFQTWWLTLPTWFNHGLLVFGGLISRLWRSLQSARPSTLMPCSLHGWSGRTYGSIGLHMHWTPAGHATAVRGQRHRSQTPVSVASNPYIPFWHVWRPDRSWSKAKWDKGSEVGLSRQPFDYAIAAIDARHELLPSLEHLNEVFDELPDERPSQPRPGQRTLGVTSKSGPPHRPGVQSSQGRSVPSIRNGDRAFVVAVNDSGNMGWVRFGRTGFASVFDM